MVTIVHCLRALVPGISFTSSPGNKVYSGNWVGSGLPMEASTRHALECKANPILSDKHVRSAKALGDRSLILPFFVASSCLLRLNAHFEVADIIAGMRMHAACTSLRTSVFDGAETQETQDVMITSEPQLRASMRPTCPPVAK